MREAIGGPGRPPRREPGGGEMLPHGVQLTPLGMNRDHRGIVTELFRQSWLPESALLQWNGVCSEAKVLRGVHVHVEHVDYVVVLRGRARFGLVDLRPGSPSEGRRAELELSGDALQALLIPPGVAHGFYFYEPALHVYGVSRYWDPADELGCRFDDPDLGLCWPTAAPILSPRDERLPPLAALRGRIPAWSPAGARRPTAGGAGAGRDASSGSA